MASDARESGTRSGPSAPDRSTSTGESRAGHSGAYTYPGGLAEATVVGRAQDGDVDSFELLLRRYQGPIFRLAYRMLSDRGEAEDVVQDCFITVWRKLPSLAEPAAFQRWVYQIATRRCLSVLRTRSRRKTDVADGDLFEAEPESAPANDPAASAEYGAQMRGLDQFLRRLPDEQRACWILRELHELTYPEIAYAMNLPVSTVRGRIARARQNLMKGMSSWR